MCGGKAAPVAGSAPPLIFVVIGRKADGFPQCAA
jgi:hypothetical protein